MKINSISLIIAEYFKRNNPDLEDNNLEGSIWYKYFGNNYSEEGSEKPDINIFKRMIDKYINRYLGKSEKSEKSAQNNSNNMSSSNINPLLEVPDNSSLVIDNKVWQDSIYSPDAEKVVKIPFKRTQPNLGDDAVNNAAKKEFKPRNKYQKMLLEYAKGQGAFDLEPLFDDAERRWVILDGCVESNDEVEYEHSTFKTDIPYAKIGTNKMIEILYNIAQKEFKNKTNLQLRVTSAFAKANNPHSPHKVSLRASKNVIPTEEDLAVKSHANRFNPKIDIQISGSMSTEKYKAFAKKIKNTQLIIDKDGNVVFVDKKDANGMGIDLVDDIRVEGEDTGAHIDLHFNHKAYDLLLNNQFLANLDS